MGNVRQKLALVFGNLPTVEEIDQFRLLADRYDISVISSESICGFLTQTSRFQDLKCIVLPDHDENPTYLPGLERVLAEFDMVVVKERLGLFAYQTVKAKWKNRFRLAVWVDNLTPFPGEDVKQMRTIRHEVSNAADMFLVQSTAAKNALLLEGIEEQRIVDFIPWAEKRIKRDKKTRAQALEALKLPESSFIIAHFGQVEWEEGLVDLVSAIKLACDQNSHLQRQLKIVFCGIGSFGNQLRDLMVSLKIDDRAVYVAPSREAYDRILEAADCLFLSAIPARGRIEGDPYRLLLAMANEVPVLASRSPLIEEYCGKHRIDFCSGSIASLAEAMIKLSEASTLRHNIVKKNAATVKSCFSAEKATTNMTQLVEQLSKQTPVVDANSLDHQVAEVESRVAAKQYLAAIDLIDSIFQVDELPVHHKANLYRLVGDCFAKLGDNDAAKDAYIQAVEIDPYSAKAYIGLGTIGLVRGSNDIAVIHFQKAITLAPGDEMANLGLGLAFQGLDENKEATKWVVKSLEINPDNAAALYTLIRISYELNEYTDVERALQNYVQRHPNDHNMIFTMAGIKYKQGRHQEALDLTQRIITADPLDARAQGLAKQARQAMDQSASVSSSKG